MAIVKERITILEFFERIHGCDGGSVSYRASDSDREVSEEEEDDGDEGSSTESQRSSSHDDDDDFISEDEDLAENR